MNIGIFGDSFLFGDGLSDAIPYPSKKVWPALIAKKLNFPFYNFSKAGAGNLYIADQVSRYISINGNNSFYFINWSYIDRYDKVEVCNSQVEYQIALTSMLDSKINRKHHIPYTEKWKSILPAHNTTSAKEYYKHFFHQYTAKLQNLLTIHSVLCQLKEKNCKYIMTYMDHLLFENEWHTSYSIEFLQQSIRNDMSTFNDLDFLSWSEKNKYAPSNDGLHPGEQSHQAAAEYWMPRVRTLLNITTKED